MRLANRVHLNLVRKDSRMFQFLQTLELYFNAFLGVIAGVTAIILLMIAVKQWRIKNEVAGALFVALAALCLMIGMCSLITDIAIIKALREAATAATEAIEGG